MATIAIRRSTGTPVPGFVLLPFGGTSQVVPFQAKMKLLAGNFAASPTAYTDLAIAYEDLEADPTAPNPRPTGSTNWTRMTSIVVLKSNGASFNPPVVWSRRGGGWTDGDYTVGDVNGDGYDDIVTGWSLGTSNKLAVRLSTGSSFSVADWTPPGAGSTHPGSRWVAGKFRSGACWDMGNIWHSGTQTAVDVYASNCSTGFANPAPWDTGVGGWAGGAWTVGDFDGDGLSDLVQAWSNGGSNKFAVRRSTGASFQVQDWLGSGGWASTTAWCAGRFN